jgi:hypothetical protein
MRYFPVILAALEQWKEWAGIRSAPARIDELERRIKVLEARLGALSTSPTAPDCPSCGTDKMRLSAESTFGPGVMTRTRLRVRHFTCSLDNCRHELTLQVPVENDGSTRLKAPPSTPGNDTALQDSPCNFGR